MNARQWLCSGGGGFEDGEDGIRACMMSGESVVELLDEFAAFKVASQATEIAELKRVNQQQFDQIRAEAPEGIYFLRQRADAASSMVGKLATALKMADGVLHIVEREAPGYDWNADRLGLTLMTGEVYQLAESLLSESVVKEAVKT